MNVNNLIDEISREPEKLHQVSPREFEEVVAELLAGFGWQVSLTQSSRDGGYDILGVSEDAPGLESTWVVECKRYSSKNKVGIEIARSLYGVKSQLGVSNALLVTTSSFTKGVQEVESSKYDISIRDHNSILEWINSYTGRPDQLPYLTDQRFYSCFISHSHKDKKFAHKTVLILSDLEKNPLSLPFIHFIRTTAPSNMKDMHRTSLANADRFSKGGTMS